MTDMTIPRRALIAGGAPGEASIAIGSCDEAALASDSFGAGLDMPAVLAAIGRGMRAAGSPEPDVCPVDHGAGRGGEEGPNVRELLDALGFDARMRAARAVIVCAPRLHERALAGSVTFEIATKARQSGVPAYAVTAGNALSAFDARILDLQLIIEASGARALAAAGRKLAGTI